MHDDPPGPTGTDARPTGTARRSSERPPRHRAFAVAAPGTEAIVEAELTALGLRSARTTRGGVRFTATTRQLYAANLWLRCATRVLVRIARFDARSFADLEAEAGAIDWSTWFEPGQPVRFRVSSSGSRLHHTGAVAERLHRASGLPAIGASDDDAGVDADADEGGPDERALIVVRIVHDQFTISVDSSGEPLARRGWRLATAKAPLRETLAAALLLAAPWDPATPLIDPFCGSGTIAIEAALLASGRAPGQGRSFAFADWPSFEPGTWSSVVADARRAADEADARERPVVIAASDRDQGAIEATLANAERAGVSASIDAERRSISEFVTVGSTPGLLLTNPPYGRRVGGTGDLRDLHARLGTVARRELPGWRVGVLVEDVRAAGSIGLRFDERLRTDNGGIGVRLLVAPVPRADLVAAGEMPIYHGGARRTGDVR